MRSVQITPTSFKNKDFKYTFLGDSHLTAKVPFMNQQASVQKTNPLIGNHDEKVLVVKREKLFPIGAWQGLQAVNGQQYLAIINEHKQFLPRQDMEINPAYKQIIPYLIFKFGSQYFLMQRQAKSIGPSRCGQNVVKATMNALAKCRSAAAIAKLRGKTVNELVKGEDVSAQ